MARNSKNIPQTRQSDKARRFVVFLFLFSCIKQRSINFPYNPYNVLLRNTILTRDLGVPVFEWVEEILRCGPIQMNSLWQYFRMVQCSSQYRLEIDSSPNKIHITIMVGSLVNQRLHGFCCLKSCALTRQAYHLELSQIMLTSKDRCSDT